MRCKDFLKTHSDFRDGLVQDVGKHREMTKHLASCARCAKYARALDEGVRVLREVPLPPASKRPFRTYQDQLGQAPVRALSAKIMAPLIAASLIALVLGPRRPEQEMRTQDGAVPITMSQPIRSAPMDMEPTVLQIASVLPTTVRGPSRPLRIVQAVNAVNASQ